MSEPVEPRYLAPAQKKYMGGQAVLEGVMMRGYDRWAVAVRTPQGDIVSQSNDAPRWAEKYAKVPLVRGIVTLVESLTLGYRALSWSAEKALPEEEQVGKAASTATLIGALLFFATLFIVSPGLLAKFISNYFDLSTFVFQLVAGLIGLSFFLGYLALIGLVPDIRRVFQYHGAEHKAIAAYENGVPVTPESCQQFSTAHVRCGTNFLLIVVVIAILVHSLFGRPDWFWLIIVRVISIPIIAAIAYEVLRLAANHMKWLGMRIIMKPGLWLQKLTTREPDLDQVDVAIASLRAAFTPDQTAEVDSRS